LAAQSRARHLRQGLTELSEGGGLVARLDGGRHQLGWGVTGEGERRRLQLGQREQ